MPSPPAPWSARLRPRSRNLKAALGPGWPWPRRALGKTLAERRGMQVAPLRLPFHGMWLRREGRSDCKHF
eukprot:1289676-Rhodomonas_salina.1